jgi:hypothetical protein
MSSYVDLSGYYISHEGNLVVTGTTSAELGEMLVANIGENEYSFQLNTTNTVDIDTYRVFSYETRKLLGTSENDVEIMISMQDDSAVKTQDYSFDIKKPNTIEITSVVRQSTGRLNVSGTTNSNEEISVLITDNEEGVVFDRTTTATNGNWEITTNASVADGTYSLLVGVPVYSGEERETFDYKKLVVEQNTEYIRFLSHKITTTNKKPTIYGTVGVSKLDGRGYDTKRKDSSQEVKIQVLDSRQSVILTTGTDVEQNGNWSYQFKEDLEEGTYTITAFVFNKNIVSREMDYVYPLHDLTLIVNSLISAFLNALSLIYDNELSSYISN